jgi:hypothetical protein
MNGNGGFSDLVNLAPGIIADALSIKAYMMTLPTSKMEKLVALTRLDGEFCPEK